MNIAPAVMTNIIQDWNCVLEFSRMLSPESELMIWNNLFGYTTNLICMTLLVSLLNEFYKLVGRWF